MKTILGLDVGVASIGWAFVQETTDNAVLVGLGSRIIPLLTNEKDEFTKGNAITTNQTRRLKRGMRRNLHRYRLRKYGLTKVLTQHAMLPDAGLFALIATELYGLRDRAVREPVSLTELGRILLHLNQKRGFRSSRKTNNDEESDSEYLTKIAQNVAGLRSAGESLTIGQYFYRALQEDPLFRMKRLIFTRSAYMDEFDRIWQTQQPFHPDTLTEALRRYLRDEVIYFQRPLKSQKHTVGECRFEWHHKVTPRSSPLFQWFKIWQNLNAIRLLPKNSNAEIPLTPEQKRVLFSVLDETPSLSGPQVIKRLGYRPGEGYKLNFERVEGNHTKAKLLAALTAAGVAGVDSLLQFELLEKTIERADKATGEVRTFRAKTSGVEQPMYRLWHLLYSVEEAEPLLTHLQKQFGLTEEQAKTVAKVGFKSDFSSVSARAICRILPYLEAGLVYSEACDAAGYRHADYRTKAENLHRTLADALAPVKKNELRSPVVERILNQVINLVNAIIADPTLGRPDEIRVELARELKQNAKQRSQTFKQNSARNREHEKLERELEQYGFRRVSAGLMERYKLFLETDGISLYTGQRMEIAAVLNGERYDVDHIIPKSRLFDDSFTNKILVERTENETKNNQTGFDYMQSKADYELDRYKAAIAANTKLSRAKREKLLMAGADIPEGFIDRQLRETQYIAREILARLSTVCRDVQSTSGSVTDYLRHDWGLDQVLKTLNRDRYEPHGLVSSHFSERLGKDLVHIEGWSKRDDHRHHAIDAVVIACTRPAYIQKLNELNQTYEHSYQLKEKARRFPQPWSGFVADVQTAVSQILVSFKAGQKVMTRGRANPANGIAELTPRGALHEESIYGQIRRYGQKPVRLGSRFDPALVDDIIDPRHRQVVAERLLRCQNDPRVAFGDLKKNPLWADSQHTIPLTEVRCYEREYPKRYPLDATFKPQNVADIVDEGVKRVVARRLADYDNDPKKAFQDLDNNPIWLNREKGICVRAVRCLTGLKNPVAIHRDEHGQLVDFVKPGDNHHVAIYEDETGKRREEVVSFWEAVSRVRAGLPVLNRHPIDGQRLVVTMQRNEMFVFGLSPDELQQAVTTNNRQLISRHLYRVQKFTAGIYYFRHHLETRLDDSEVAKNMKRFICVSSLKNMTGIKVRLNVLGQVVQIGDKLA